VSPKKPSDGGETMGTLEEITAREMIIPNVQGRVYEIEKLMVGKGEARVEKKSKGSRGLETMQGGKQRSGSGYAFGRLYLGGRPGQRLKKTDAKRDEETGTSGTLKQTGGAQKGMVKRGGPVEYIVKKK